ncbi:helix-turn-helix domain-containing protein [Streptomyces sp. NBC_00887]|uniref:helix-turn-helix transcriptional regulator n=1 Tax=Streptomyces sp. NBC_00887 TaxID=2975859 RepID=UPI0038631DB6|nr:helix-turn-helix domain-containing protein [Streptomyces sp. NBC_00887]WSY36318.1 helix-turn-helix domain-containing protein [Streptomyces sp. NBC_00887]
MKQTAIHLDDLPRIVNIGVGVHGVAHLHDTFRLPDLWQLHLYGYTAKLTLGDTVHPIRPGHVSLIPPDTQAHYHYRGRSEHLYAHLRLAPTGAPRTVAVMQDAAAETPMLSDLLRRALVASRGAPSEATAAVWTVLWRVVNLAGLDHTGRPHAAVAAAMAHIETHLADPLAVPDIARAGGVSPNHLTRLFRTETGDTVVAYIRRRRLERARHLLRASTLPIPAVAAAVGISDLQAFNKACRSGLGSGPRAYRSGAPGQADAPR